MLVGFGNVVRGDGKEEQKDRNAKQVGMHNSSGKGRDSWKLDTENDWGWRAMVTKVRQLGELCDPGLHQADVISKPTR